MRKTARKKNQIQRRWVVDSVYSVEGVSEKQRSLRFIGRMKLHGRKEYLVFKPMRKASKTKP